MFMIRNLIIVICVVMVVTPLGSKIGMTMHDMASISGGLSGILAMIINGHKDG